MKPPTDPEKLAAYNAIVPEIGSKFVNYDGYLGAIGAFMNEFADDTLLVDNDNL